MAVEAYPEIGDVTAQVVTQTPGLASEEVEQQITIPLERALAGTPGLDSMRSSSTFGLSLITLVFRDGAEDYWSRQRMMDRINKVSLPDGIQPGLDPVTGAVGEIYRYTLESDTKNLMELSEIQRWIVIPALEQVPGVVNVDNFGGFTMQYQVELDPAQLQRYGIGLNDVVTAINNNSSNAGGSRISRGEQGYVIRGIGMVRTLDDLGNIVVTSAKRRANSGARSRQDGVQPSGARGHPRQGQQSGHHRRHRRSAQVSKSIGSPERHPCQGGGTEQTTRIYGCAHSSLYRQGRPGAGDGAQGLAYST